MIFYFVFLPVAVILFCRYALSKARNQLSLEQKGQFLEITSSPKNHMLYGIFIAVLLISMKTHFVPFQLLFLLIYILIFGFGIAKNIADYKKMKALNFPSSYLQSMENYSIIRYAALLAFIAFMGIAFYSSILKFYHL